MTTHSTLKRQVAYAALQYIGRETILGVGTGSTVNCLIDILVESRHPLRGAVSSSEATSQRLRAGGIPVFSTQEVTQLEMYIDGADEINPQGCMIKGGGAALTREKIVAAMAKQFLCIADESKWVQRLGRFPLPVEVIPMATGPIMERFTSLGGRPVLRVQSGLAWRTDNHMHIVDVHDLWYDDPMQWEQRINQWPGVVTVGLFAQQHAHRCLLGTAQGVRTVDF